MMARTLASMAGTHRELRARFADALRRCAFDDADWFVPSEARTFENLHAQHCHKGSHDTADASR